MANKSKGERLAKAALAKAHTINVNITGEYEDDRVKFNAMAADLGIEFDTLNQVTINQIKTDVALLIQKVSALATMLSSSFDGAGNILTDGYAIHTHGYIDTTISDTADGSGVSTDTSKTTAGVS